MIESLERRRLLASAVLNNGILTISGSSTVNDTIVISINGANYHVSGEGLSQDTPIAQVTVGILVAPSGGDDSVTVDGNVTAPMTVYGGAGNDSLSGGAGRDQLWGDAGNDQVLGNGGKDVVIGGDGNDTLSGGTKNDILWGGPGGLHGRLSGNARSGLLRRSHLARVDVSLDGLANDGESGEGDTITDTCESFEGGSAGDFIRGSGKDNVLTGNGGNDTLIGGSGNDTLIGNAGQDSLDGQSGDDHFVSSGDNEVDSLFGGSGIDTADKDSIDIATSVV